MDLLYGHIYFSTVKELGGIGGGDGSGCGCGGGGGDEKVGCTKGRDGRKT